MAGIVDPEVFGITAIACGGVEFGDDGGVVGMGDPIQEIAGDAIAGIIACAIEVAAGDFGASCFRFVEEPADVVGDSFHEPAGVAGGVGVGSSGAAIALDDVDQLVHD